MCWMGKYVLQINQISASNNYVIIQYIERQQALPNDTTLMLNLIPILQKGDNPTQN